MKFSLERPVKIVMLGAGGTGGHIAPHLYRLLYSLDRPVRYIICDGDVVERKNLVRQNFIPADLGENKAKVLAERYSTVFGMETEYVPDFIEDEARLKQLVEPREWRTQPDAALPLRQNVVDHVHDHRGGRDVCRDALRRGDRRLRTTQLCRELVRIAQHVRVHLADRTIERPAGAADTADDLTGVLPVAAVDVDEVRRLVKHLMTELTAAVVVHRADQDDQLRNGFAAVRLATFSTTSCNVRPTLQKQNSRRKAA